MENKKFIKNLKEKIELCLGDYSNDFVTLDLIFKGSGIEGVCEYIENGYKIPTVEDYLQQYRLEGRETISVEDEKDSMFIEKAKRLNELANRINSLGKDINKQIIKETIEEARKIIYN